MIGDILEKYEVLEKIGEGGMATVYRGRHTTLDRTVAIKVLHPHLSSSEKNRTRFAREAKAIESLRHQNILRIFDYSGPDSDRCFIVTELIHGPTLRQLLDEVGAMMAEPAALVAHDLCRALQIAHGKRIIHRDLKPENIMLTLDGEVKLMDFGIARLADDIQVTMTGALVGSPAYMSPEQATSQPVDHRSDIFALGTVLYRMVTGSLPFQGSNPSIVLKNIIEGTFDDPLDRVPSLSPQLAAIIGRCLALEPTERFETAEELRVALEGFLRDLGIEATAPEGWSLAAYIDQPEDYEDGLREHLVEALLARGRRETERGSTAEALRTFNRVLALDEDNTEVLTIISSIR
ncbi:MAG: serine/threonine-protein kinase, partial [Myxococcota bacterium]|nr:serine/threonine-protein kinase [Myxococcota bacterium]